MKHQHMFWFTGLVPVLLAGVTASATIFVQDSVITNGVKSYTNGASLAGQDATNGTVGVSVAGKWGTGTSVFIANALGLQYPANILLNAAGGSFADLNGSTSTTDGRIMVRAVTGLPTSGSFFFSMLLRAESGLTNALVSGHSIGFGLCTNTATGTIASPNPPVGGVYFGVQNSGGTYSVMLRVNGTSYPLLTSPVPDQTYFCVGKVELGAGPGGQDIIRAVVDPSVADVYTLSVTNSVLPAGTTFTTMALAGTYRTNNKKAIFDELKVGSTWMDVAPIPDASYPVFNNPPTVSLNSQSNFVFSATLNEGSANTAVIACYGKTQGSTSVGSWEMSKLVTATPTLNVAATTTLDGLAANTCYYYAVLGTNANNAVLKTGATLLNGEVWLTFGSDAQEEGLVAGSAIVHRPSSATQTVLTVNYTVSGSAVEGVNYVSNSLVGSMTIPAGQDTAPITVTPLIEAANLSNTTVVLTLATGAYVIGSSNATTVTIRNYDFPADKNCWIAPAPGTASDSNNWSQGRVPIASDSILLDIFSTNAMTWDAGSNGVPDTVATWTQSSNFTGAVTFPINYTNVAGATFTNFSVTGNVIINGGSWTHPSNNTTQAYHLQVTIGGDFTLGAGAVVTVQGKGYGINKFPSGGAAGVYGGSRDDFTKAYGDLYHPADIGAGGSSSQTGGGAVWLDVIGAATIDGVVNARAADSGAQAAIGAGGSVYLRAASVSGAGSVTVSGNGYYQQSSGSGGRIAVELTQATTLGMNTTNFTARGGWGGTSTGAGTILIKTATQPYGTLIVDNSGVRSYGCQPPTKYGTTCIASGQTWAVDALVFRNYGILSVPTGTTLRLPNGLDSVSSPNAALQGGILYMGGTIELGNGTPWTFTSNWVFQADSPYAITGTVTVTRGGALGCIPLLRNTTNAFARMSLTVVGDLNIAADGKIVADNAGVDSSTYANLTKGYHGGQSAADASNKAYGSILNPIMPGGQAQNNDAGTIRGGGGSVTLTVTGTLNVDGTVSATSTSGTDWHGAGGAVNITAGTLTGGGTIKANGGTATSGNYAGGGGRVAVRLTGSGSTFDAFGTGDISATGYTVGTNTSSSAGTLYLQTAATTEGAGQVVIRNDNNVGNSNSVTWFPSLIHGGETDVLDRASLSLEKRAIVRLTKTLAMNAGAIEAGAKLDLNGFTLTVKELSVAGSLIASGTYAATDFASGVIDSAGVSGRIVVGTQGMFVSGNGNRISGGALVPVVSNDTDFGVADVAGQTVDHTFTITNCGPSVLQLTGTPAVVLSGPNASDFQVLAQPGMTSVAVGESVTFTIRFDPAAVGACTALVAIANDDATYGPSFNFTIRGDGMLNEPIMGVVGNGYAIPNGSASVASSNHTDFGSVGILAAAMTRTFTITNANAIASLSLTGSPVVVVGGAHASDFSVTADPATPVGPLGATTVTIAFVPGAAGARTGVVSIVNNDSDQTPYTFTIQGTGVDPVMGVLGKGYLIPNGAASVASSNDTSFGAAGTNLAILKTFTITNSGSLGYLVLTGSPSVSISGPQASDFTVVTNVDSATLSPSSKTNFTIQFKPTGLGSRTGTVSIVNSDTDQTPYTFMVEGVGTDAVINVMGKGVVIANGDASPSTSDDTDFGSAGVGSNVVKTFTITNASTLAYLCLNGTPSVTISGADAAEFSVVTNPVTTITTTNKTTFSVRLAPLTAGLKTATVSIPSDDLDRTPYTFAIQGTGVDPVMSVLGKGVAIAYGSTVVSTNDDTSFGAAGTNGFILKTFTITNSGAQGYLMLTNSSAWVMGGPHPADFSVTNVLAATNLPPAGKLAFTVRFQPTAVGSRTGTVSIANNDTDQNPYWFTMQGIGTDAVINVMGKGVLIPNGAATCSTSDDTDFGSVGVNNNGQKTFTITNASTLAYLGLNGTPSITFSGANASDFSVITNPATLITSTNKTTFTVRLTPSASGLRSATVNIPNDDQDRTPYTFAIQGTGVDAVMGVLGGGQVITNGQAPASLSNDTVIVSSTNSYAERAFTITNTSTLGVLLLTNTPAVTISGPDANRFSVSVAPTSSVPPLGKTTFNIRFTPVSAGTNEALVTILNTDPNQPQFTFAIGGQTMSGAKVWTGAGGDGLGSNPDNWTYNALPGAGDEVILDGTSSSNLTWDAPNGGLPTTVASWTQTSNYTGTVTFPINFPNVAGATFTNFSVAGDVFINGGTWTHPAHTNITTAMKTNYYRLDVRIGGNLMVATNASITASNKGSYGAMNGSGGAYGGANSYGNSYVYGDLHEPVDVGSSVLQSSNIYAGGAIWLDVASNVVVDGSIDCNGRTAVGTFGNNYSSSGGSIYLKASSLSGGGTITANGSTIQGSTTSDSGSGGRISILLTGSEMSFPMGNIKAFGGSSYGNVAGAGTIVVRTPTKPNGTLYVKNFTSIYGQYAYRPTRDQLTIIPSGKTWTLDALVTSDYGILSVPSGTTLVLSNGFASVSSSSTERENGIFYNGGTIVVPATSTHTISGYWTFQANAPYTFNGDVVVTNDAAIGAIKLYSTYTNNATRCLATVTGGLTVASNGYIYADAGGYAFTSNTVVSGSHGGQNGQYTNTTAVYDSILNPAQAGAFGGDKGMGSWGYGGGAVTLVVGGTLQLDGTATANGALPSSGRPGGAGTLNITAARLQGTGKIQANGSTRTTLDGTNRGASGGGRVAVRLTDPAATFSTYWTTNSNARGATPTTASAYSNTLFASSAGTVYLQTAADGENGGLIIVRNDNNAANTNAFTPIPSRTYGGELDVFTQASLSLESRAVVKLTESLQMVAVTVATGAKLDLNGCTLTVRFATVAGEQKAFGGIYVPADFPSGVVVDSSVAQTGKIVVLSAGSVYLLR